MQRHTLLAENIGQLFLCKQRIILRTLFVLKTTWTTWDNFGQLFLILQLTLDSVDAVAS